MLDFHLSLLQYRETGTILLAMILLVALGGRAGQSVAESVVVSLWAYRTEFVKRFVEEMKAGGFVAETLKRHGIEGATVAE